MNPTGLLTLAEAGAESHCHRSRYGVAFIRKCLGGYELMEVCFRRRLSFFTSVNDLICEVTLHLLSLHHILLALLKKSDI